MENASKALLIAASVLIVILLIAFGMRIFNSTKGTAEQAQGTTQTTEMAMFNNKFLPYVGTKKTKNQALSLLNIIQAHNATNSTRQITVHFAFESGGNTTGLSKTNDWRVKKCISRVSGHDSNTTYTITISDSTDGSKSGYTNGYISAIFITDEK